MYVPILCIYMRNSWTVISTSSSDSFMPLAVTLGFVFPDHSVMSHLIRAPSSRKSSHRPKLSLFIDSFSVCDYAFCNHLQLHAYQRLLIGNLLRSLSCEIHINNKCQIIFLCFSLFKVDLTNTTNPVSMIIFAKSWLPLAFVDNIVVRVYILFPT